MRKVLIINGDYLYTKLFADAGWVVTKDPKQILDCQLVCFTGGEDVSPSYYGEAIHPQTYSNIVRDEYEKQYFLIAIENDIPCVGICRGGQFLNVMNGGKMYQHVSHHCGSHEIDILDWEYPESTITATSTHHQMMRPTKEAFVLAEASQNGFKEYMRNGEVVEAYGAEESQDIEVVFYPHTKCLCFQPHPEFKHCEPLKELFHFFVNKYCN